MDRAKNQSFATMPSKKKNEMVISIAVFFFFFFFFLWAFLQKNIKFKEVYQKAVYSRALNKSYSLYHSAKRIDHFTFTIYIYVIF